MNRRVLFPVLALSLLTTSPTFADAMKSQLYEDLVAPILAAKCAGCHGEKRPKGKLRVDSLEALLKGGNEGSSVIAGKVDESPLLQRVYLPLDDDEHMPPEDKDQLTPEETAVLAFWITSGAKGSGTVAEFKPDAKATAALTHVLGNLPEAPEKVAKADAPKADPAMDKLVAETIGSVEKIGASLMPIAQNTPELRFSALNVSKEFSDDQLAVLKPISARVKWIDLARTKVGDKGLVHLAGMNNLTRLHLENTAVTDAGLDSLKGLTNLEYLNLYGTKITDAGLQKLAPLKKLKKLFIWQTKATDAGATKLAAAIPGIDINTGWKAPKAEPVVLAANTKTAAPAKPEAKPAPAKPAAKPATPPAKPAAKPAAKPTPTKAETKPAPAKPAAKPTPAPAKPAAKPTPAKPETKPAPAKPAAKPTPAPAKPAPAADPMFAKAVTEVQSAADEAAKRAAQAKADFAAAIKTVEEATKRAEALKASSEKASAVAAEAKAALDQLKKAVETSKK
ncbi:MAG: hypothetical protein GXX91_13785 [Verrucomicrobiaceae bacterium]|nr:hypothetical protein [Verrucomicrobiaceae bacterium]